MPAERNSKKIFLKPIAAGTTSLLIAPEFLVSNGFNRCAKGNERWAGVGHSAHYTMEGSSIMIMHGYDKTDNGRSKLIIREMKWDRSDWPSIDL